MSFLLRWALTPCVATLHLARKLFVMLLLVQGGVPLRHPLEHHLLRCIVLLVGVLECGPEDRMLEQDEGLPAAPN